MVRLLFALNICHNIMSEMTDCGICLRKCSQTSGHFEKTSIFFSFDLFQKNLSHFDKIH